MSDSDKISEVLNFRVVIPSWKAPDQAIEKSSSDQTLLLKRKKNATKWLKELMSAYEQNPTDHGATELYEVASLYGEIAQLPKSIANLPHLSKLKIKAHKNSSLWELNPLRDGLDFSLGEEIDVHKQSAIAGIGKFRKLLISNPSRPFCWSELARHYLVVGEKEKAIRCMQTAMHLTKNNRYLSRAATRLFVHVKEHERALELLRSEPSLKNDPWLLSAEIATSAFANKQSTNIKTAQQLLISGRYNNYQLSELAAAVGTVEIEHGATKKAKNLFNTSLITPTANSLAQAQWAVGQDSSIVIPASAWQTPDSYEASTLVARQERNWTKAIMECAKWLADEPFSIRPIYMGSYISFCPNLYSTAEKFANAGLRCDPNNTTLLNNRAVARAYLGRLDEAFIDVKTAQGNNEAKESAHLLATLGLIAFRSDLPDLGRSYYNQSIAWFLQIKDRESLASAILHMIKEEIRIDASQIPVAIEIVNKIKTTTDSAKYPELYGSCESLLKEIDAKPSENQEAACRSTLSSDEFKHQASLFEFPKKSIGKKNMMKSISDIRKLI